MKLHRFILELFALCHDVRDTSLSSAHVGSTRSGTRASCCRREHGRERTVLNRASIFVNFVNHFPLQIAPYFTALTVFTVTQGEAEMPPSPAHELCKLISQQQLDKAVDYFESLYLCFCGRVGNSVNEPIASEHANDIPSPTYGS